LVIDQSAGCFAANQAGVTSIGIAPRDYVSVPIDENEICFGATTINPDFEIHNRSETTKPVDDTQ
jgi:hypothetical protein